MQAGGRGFKSRRVHWNDFRTSVRGSCRRLGPTRRVRTQDPTSLRPEIAWLEGAGVHTWRHVWRTDGFPAPSPLSTLRASLRFPQRSAVHCYPPHGNMWCHGSRYGLPNRTSYPAPRPPGSGGPGLRAAVNHGSRADEGAHAWAPGSFERSSELEACRVLGSNAVPDDTHEQANEATWGTARLRSRRRPCQAAKNPG